MPTLEVTGMTRNRSWKDLTVIFLGIWVFVSPWAFAQKAAIAISPAGADGFMNLNLFIVGMLVAILGYSAVRQFADWKEWSVTILGGWLIILPCVWGVSAVVIWATALAGFMIMTLSWSRIANAQILPWRSNFSKSDLRFGVPRIGLPNENDHLAGGQVQPDQGPEVLAPDYYDQTPGNTVKG